MRAKTHFLPHIQCHLRQSSRPCWEVVKRSLSNLGGVQPSGEAPAWGRWRLWAELEKRDEGMKLRMAQLLQDLHELAAERSPAADAGSAGQASRQREGTAATLVVNVAKGHDTGARLPFDMRAIRPEDVRDNFAAFADNTLLHADSLLRLLKAGAQALIAEPTVVNLRSRQEVRVVGDLHGSIASLQEVLRLSETPSSDNAVVFNGDFVDRGKHGVEVLATLLLLKLAYPQDVFLLRGNHEDGFLSTVYGFKQELGEKYPAQADTLWQATLEVFAALPLCAVTSEAFIVHGGLPKQELLISQLEAITAEQRNVPSVLKRLREDSTWAPMDKKAVSSQGSEAIFQGLLWADPTNKEDGISRNTRRGSTMVKFGKDVARTFLKRHDLLYLVRSHEVKYEGWDFIDSGDGTMVITVFSAASYPADEGHNKGAVLKLCVNKQPEPLCFGVDVKKHSSEFNIEQSHQTIMELVVAHRNRLQEAFERIDNSGNNQVTVDEWAQIMRSVLDLDLDWKALQPVLVNTVRRFPVSTSPETPTRTTSISTGFIDFNRFLRQYVVMHSNWQGQEGQEESARNPNEVLEALYRNHEQLNIVFSFLDADGNGAISKEEFVAGVTLVNERLPPDEHMTDADALFEALDIDKNGEIALDEFCEIFKVQEGGK